VLDAFLDRIEPLLLGGNATEHSYRPALQTLLESAIPNSSALNEPRRSAAGAPDFVLNQGQTPFAWVEAKDIGSALETIVTDSVRATPRTREGKQLKRYRANLPNLLFTDGLVWYWFVNGENRTPDPITIGTWRSATRRLTHIPAAFDAWRGLLAQVAAQQLPTINTPRDLAQRLAQYAAWLREKIEDALRDATDNAALRDQLQAFDATLLPGLDEATFADMYAQTIVYGLFTARVTHSQQTPSTPFTRHIAATTIPNSNPFLRRLFQEVAGYDLDERIMWLVDDTAMLLNQTDMGAVLANFGRATQQEDPVVHFYETFLAAYDPALRESRGVYYTPEPVVGYIVRSVDWLLRHRFGKAQGLADHNTTILDPATGTATFLHRVIQHIHGRVTSGMAGGWQEYVRHHLIPRLFGFELLMAPYTVAHLKLGLLLQQTGYTFAPQERLGIYLTNALSDLPDGQATFPFARVIVEEGQRAADVKRDRPVMVVLGNPPYSNFGQLNKGAWISELLELYKRDLNERKINLDDDYIKFLRFGQWRIDRTGQGILAFITNNSYINGITHRQMRRSLMTSFSEIYILNLHGRGGIRGRETSPDGTPDENVFDIQQGVCITLFVKTPGFQGEGTVYYADLWGNREGKYEFLNAQSASSTTWEILDVIEPDYFFVPKDFSLASEYNVMAQLLNDIFVSSNAGIQTKRDNFVYQFTIPEVEKVILDLVNQETKDIRTSYNLDQDSAEWRLEFAKHDVTSQTGVITPVLYRPFDLRFTYYTGKTKGFMARPRAPLMREALQDNLLLLTVRNSRRGNIDNFFVANTIVDKDAVSSYDNATFFPLYIYRPAPATVGQTHRMELDGDDYDPITERKPNFSPTFLAQVEEGLGVPILRDGKGDGATTVGVEDIFHYLYALLHSPVYRERYSDFLEIDFARLPVPNDMARFRTLAGWGAQLVDLHLVRLPGAGGVGGNGGAVILAEPTEAGVTFPIAGASQVGRGYPRYDASDQRVYINPTQYFTGVAIETWQHTIGGFQPLEKWLKDRRERVLSYEELEHYRRMVIALHETRRIMADIEALGL
jgi:predicted helicase